MKNNLVCLLLLCTPLPNVWAHPIPPENTRQELQKLSLTLTDLPEDTQKDIFTQVIRASRDNIAALLLVHPTFPPLIHASCQPFPYIAKIIVNKVIWTQQAVHAALKHQEPEHLLQLAEFETTFLLEKLLQAKEKSLNTSTEWKKHGLAALLTISAAWDAAKKAAMHATWDTAPATSTRHPSSTHAAWDAARRATQTLTWHTSWDAAKTAAWNAAWENAKTAAQTAASHALQTHTHAQHTAKIAYRVAETHAWITFADPEKQALEKAYDAAYKHLPDHDLSPNTWNWLSSRQSLEASIQKHFGPQSPLGKDENLLVSQTEYQYRYQFVQPLIQNLRRIVAQAEQLQAQGL
ncbi:MAG: hypothetical protein OXT67_10205 [Zetaproteobacteria bacterium]|nr:hypothetical protein [Zetaproteobacteria bacterium]